MGEVEGTLPATPAAAVAPAAFAPPTAAVEPALAGPPALVLFAVVPALPADAAGLGLAAVDPAEELVGAAVLPPVAAVTRLELAAVEPADEPAGAAALVPLVADIVAALPLSSDWSELQLAAPTPRTVTSNTGATLGRKKDRRLFIKPCNARTLDQRTLASTTPVLLQRDTTGLDYFPLALPLPRERSMRKGLSRTYQLGSHDEENVMKQTNTFQSRTSAGGSHRYFRSTDRVCWTLGLLLLITDCASTEDSKAGTEATAGTNATTAPATAAGATSGSAGTPASGAGGRTGAPLPANTTGQGLSPGETEYPAAIGETATITTVAGPVIGEIVDHEGTPVNIFRGIPYAAAAVGNLRFAPPAPVTPWTEPRKAKPWADRCPQVESRLTANGAISEDCLNLNVVTPSLDGAAGLPVMVFYHGGGLTIGTANSPTYSHFALPAQENVVVVTVNQRLGPIGYLAHPALAAESANASSGNYGTLDQIASLEWVRDNIAAFGGDPNNVTIFGESGGGTKVLSCVGSPRCKGLFHRAIVQSGSGSNGQGAMAERATAEQQGVALAAKLGIAADDPDALQKLRAARFEDIVAAAEDPAVGFRTNITVDGWVFPKSIYDAIQEGSQADVPLIVGANEAEASLLSGSVPDLAIAMASVPSKAYVYNFTRLPPGWQVDSCPGAFHGLELAYVFGHIPWALTSPTMVFLGLQAGCPTNTDPAATEVDKQIAVNAMKIWGQFARTGNPSVAGLIEWPPYTAAGDQYLDIGEQLIVKTGVRTSGVAASGIGGSMN